MTSATVSLPATARVGAIPGVLLLLGSCMAPLASTLLSPVLPIMEQVYKTSPVPPALILSAPALFVAIFAPFAGQIVDRFGRRNLLIIAMLLYTVIGTAPAWLPQSVIESAIFPLLGLRLLTGLCEAAIMTCCTTLVGDYYQGERRNRYLGLQTLATTISATIFLLAAGIVVGADPSRWRIPFWIYGLALIIAIPMIFIIKEPNRGTKSARRTVKGAKIPWAKLWLPLIVTIFGGIVFFVLVAESALVYNGVGVTNTQTIGIISAGASVATAIGALIFAPATRLTAKILLPISFGLTGVGLLIVWISAPAQSVPFVITGSVIGSLGTGLLLPTMLVWTVGRLGFEERGRATGLWQSAFFLGQFVSPILIQVLQGIHGGAPAASLPIALGSIGVVCLIIAAILGVFVRRVAMSMSTAEAETAEYGEVARL